MPDRSSEGSVGGFLKRPVSPACLAVVRRAKAEVLTQADSSSQNLIRKLFINKE